MGHVSPSAPGLQVLPCTPPPPQNHLLGRALSTFVPQHCPRTLSAPGLQVLHRTPTSCTLTHFPFNLKGNKRVAKYAVYAKVFGAGVALILNKTASEYPGGQVQVRVLRLRALVAPDLQVPRQAGGDSGHWIGCRLKLTSKYPGEMVEVQDSGRVLV